MNTDEFSKQHGGVQLSKVQKEKLTTDVDAKRLLVGYTAKSL